MKTLVLSLLLICGAACSVTPLPRRSIQDEIHVCGRDFAALNSGTRRVVDVITRLPDWERLGDEHLHSFITPEVLEAAAAQVETASIADIRSAVEILTRPEHHWLEIHGRVYVFMRAVFPIPEMIPVRRAQVFGGWLTPSTVSGGGIDEDLYLLSWPIVRMDGRIVKIEPFMGYLGAPYRAVDEFDYFEKNWPIR